MLTSVMTEARALGPKEDLALRIAIGVTEFPLISETFILNQITGLLELGHDVEVQAIHRGDFSLLDGRWPELRLRTKTGRMPWSAALRLIRANRALNAVHPEHAIALRKTLNPFRFGRNALSLRLLYAGRSWAGRTYDIIHCHFGENGNLAAQIKDLGLTDAPLLTTFHGYDLRQGLSRGEGVWPHLKRHGDVFLAISRYSRECLLELGFDEDRIVHHPVGIDPSRFPFRWQDPDVEPLQTDPVRVLSVGRMVPEKGHVFGVQAIHELIRRRPGLDVEYTVVGDGPARKQVSRLARTLGVEKVVRLPGAASRCEVAAALQRADIFLLPSVAEILPIVLMEAQATGLPLVTTNVGATTELVEEEASGFIVPPRDVPGMVDRLEYLIDHPELHPQLGRRGRAIVEERYDIRRLNERLVSIYRSL